MNLFTLFRHKKFLPKSISSFFFFLFLFSSFFSQTSFALTSAETQEYNNLKTKLTECRRIAEKNGFQDCSKELREVNDFATNNELPLGVAEQVGQQLSEEKKLADEARLESLPLGQTRCNATNSIYNPKAPNADKNGCAKSTGWCTGGFSIPNCLSDLADLIIGNILWLINLVLSSTLGFVSWFLDIIIYMTVVKFRSNFSDLNLNVTGNVEVFGNDLTGTRTIGLGETLLGAGRGDLIYYIWGILRDFLNIIILITLIYTAVRTMFDGFETHKKKFIYLLLFSIVMNFSLLMVKLAIDVSNILTLQAYTLIVNPVGFDTWDNFRKRDGDFRASNIGEYIMNSVNLGSLEKIEVGTKAAEERIVGGIKNSWVFQLGRMLTYIGVIYLLFFIGSLLLVRAAAFVFAMMLAAFLAADLFFQFAGGGKDNGADDFMEAVRGVTANIKNDFYDGLLKGPILFFFLFIIGVLANAIFTQGVSSEITRLAEGSGEIKSVGGAFALSISIFLKFAIFFALAQAVMKRLDAFSLSGTHTKKFTNALTNWGLRNTVGGVAGATGWIGRNTIGRGVGSLTNRLSTGLANRDISLTNRINDLKDDKSLLGRSKRFRLQLLQGTNRLAQGGNNAVKGSAVVKGTYDTRGGLAAAAKRATGTDADFGKAKTEGYEAEDITRQKDRAKKESDATEKTVADIKLTKKEEVNAYATTTAKFAGQDLSVTEMENVLKDAEDGGEALKNSVASVISSGGNASFVIGGKRFSEQDAKKIVDKTVPGNLDQLYHSKKEETKKKAEDKKKTDYQESRTVQDATGGSRTFPTDTFNLPNITSGATTKTEEDAQHKLLEGARKKAKDDADKLKRQDDSVKRTILGSVSDIESILGVAAVGTLPQPNRAGIAAEITKLDDFKTFVDDQVNPKPLLGGGTTKKSDAQFIKEFNEKYKDSLFDAKSKILKELDKQYIGINYATLTAKEQSALKGRRRSIEDTLKRVEARKTEHEAITKPEEKKL